MLRIRSLRSLHLSIHVASAIGWDLLLEVVTQGKLLLARLDQRRTVNAEASAGHSVVQPAKAADGIGIEARRVRYVEHFPSEPQGLIAIGLPDFRQTRVLLEISVSPEYIAAPRFPGVWVAKWMASRDA